MNARDTVVSNLSQMHAFTLLHRSQHLLLLLIFCHRRISTRSDDIAQYCRLDSSIHTTCLQHVLCNGTMHDRMPVQRTDACIQYPTLTPSSAKRNTTGRWNITRFGYARYNCCAPRSRHASANSKHRTADTSFPRGKTTSDRYPSNIGARVMTSLPPAV